MQNQLDLINFDRELFKAVDEYVKETRMKENER